MRREGIPKVFSGGINIRFFSGFYGCLIEIIDGLDVRAVDFIDLESVCECAFLREDLGRDRIVPVPIDDADRKLSIIYSGRHIQVGHIFLDRRGLAQTEEERVGIVGVTIHEYIEGGSVDMAGEKLEGIIDGLLV